MKIRLLELFSGIGGFAKGLMDAGFELERVWYSEIDKHAKANYKYNFPHAEYIGSVTDVSGAGLDRPNIITFGSPCQDFSLAGNRLGMDGARSSLILHAIRLVTELRPDFFIWENVKGAFSSNDSADFWGIIQAFANIGGYRIEWQLLNTAWFLPQNRERIYLIGHLATAGRSFKGVFPIGERCKENFENCGEGELWQKDSRQIASTLMQRDYKDGSNFIRQLSTNKESGGVQPYQQNRVYDDTGIVPALLSDMSCGAHAIAQRGRGKKGELVQQFESRNDGLTNSLTSVQKDNLIVHNLQPRSGDPNKGGTGHLTKSDGTTYCIDTGNTNAIEIGDFRADEGFRWRDNQNSPTLQARAREDGSGQAILKNGAGIRRLTEIECERLQGYPDNWTEWGIYEKEVWINKKEWLLNKKTEKTFEIVFGKHKVPKTQRYKLCGNAVTVAVVKEIGLRLKKNYE